MTSIHGSLRNLLLASEDVTDLVSTRIYPMKIPFGAAYPAISIHEISGTEDYVVGHEVHRYQISCFAETFAAVQSMKNAVKACLNRYSGEVDGNTIASISFQSSMEFYEDESRMYHIPLDFQVVHYNYSGDNQMPADLADGGSA